MGFWGQNRGWHDIDPLTNSFFLLGVLMSVPLLVKIDHGMQPWECPQRDTQIHWQTQTDFIICPCYSYGTDNNTVSMPAVTSSRWCDHSPDVHKSYEFSSNSCTSVDTDSLCAPAWQTPSCTSPLCTTKRLQHNICKDKSIANLMICMYMDKNYTWNGHSRDRQHNSIFFSCLHLSSGSKRTTT